MPNGGFLMMPDSSVNTITVQLRKYILAVSLVAIRGAFGIQERLSLLGYNNVVYNDEAIESGTFYLSAASGRFYKVALGVNGVTGLSVLLRQINE